MAETEEQKKANWADESDEEWSEHEDKGFTQPKSQTLLPNQKKDMIVEKIKKSSFPLVLYLGNLPYSIKEQVLLSELKISDKSELTYIKEEGRFSGNAKINVDNIEDAMLIAEKAYTDLLGRIIFVSFFLKDKNYQGEKKDFDRRGGRGRGGRGNQKNNNRRGGYNQDDRQSSEKNTFRSKTDFKSSKIVIASSENSAQQVHSPSKPKANPFGDAKPVNTSIKDLEFEKKLDENKISKEEHEENTSSHAKTKKKTLKTKKLLKNLMIQINQKEGLTQEEDEVMGLEKEGPLKTDKKGIIMKIEETEEISILIRKTQILTEIMTKNKITMNGAMKTGLKS